MANQNLPATQKAANIRTLLEKSKAQMALALPKHLTSDRLLRVAMTSIQKTPKLLDCTPQSLLACVMTCAQLGLEPDQFLGQAYLVPYGNVCTLIPGYRGYIALARRSGELQTLSAQVVYSNDEFSLQYGVEDTLIHKPALNGRGEALGAHCVFKYKDGGYSFDWMSKEDIEKIRKRSKASDNGPWVTDWDEMAKKTVIKRHAKLAPLSVEFQKAVELENRAMNGESQSDLLTMNGADDGIIDAEPTDDSTPEQINAEFDSTIPAGTDLNVLNEFLASTAKRNNATVDAVKAEAVKDPSGFWKIFKAYVKTRQQKNGKPADNQEKPPALAPRECPDHPGNTYNAEYCAACAKRQGCPAWD